MKLVYTQSNNKNVFINAYVFNYIKIGPLVWDLEDFTDVRYQGTDGHHSKNTLFVLVEPQNSIFFV